MEGISYSSQWRACLASDMVKMDTSSVCSDGGFAVSHALQVLRRVFKARWVHVNGFFNCGDADGLKDVHAFIVAVLCDGFVKNEKTDKMYISSLYLSILLLSILYISSL